MQKGNFCVYRRYGHNEGRTGGNTEEWQNALKAHENGPSKNNDIRK